ncbi:hypothetical protein BYT27DRAFT_7200560 [Phlegmacium glaucopus]|nr:hypothetical protein BYT27DRAFT_7200560 [Phlegmacium glaucopus]
MSDNELPEPSDPETQFIPQEDDDETLWEVIEITAEKGHQYKVRWKGIDPETRKPWAQSWVAKHDCTDDLVRDWKLRQAKKKKKGSKREPGMSKKSRASVVSSPSMLTSKGTASPLKLDNADSTRRSTSTTTAITARRGRSKATDLSPSIHKRNTRSRAPIEIHSPDPLGSSHTRSPSVVDMSPTRTGETPRPDSTVNANTAAASTPTIPTQTGTKRKHGETISTTTSARIPASSTPGIDAGTNNISGSVPPPRKKRKLEVSVHYEHSAKVGTRRRRKSVSIIASDDDHDDYVEVKTESDKNIELGPEPSEIQRRSPSLVEAEEREEEADERMVEESLSDIYCSPSPPLETSHDQEDEGTPVPHVRAQSLVHRRQDMAEESTPTISRPQHQMERRTDSPPINLIATTSKLDPPSKKRTRSVPASSSAAAVTVPGTATTSTIKYSILSQVARSKTTPPGAKKRKKTSAPMYPSTVSKQQWEELNDFQSQQVLEPETVASHDGSERGVSDLEGMDMDHPVIEEVPPPASSANSAPDQASRSRAGSTAGSQSHSLRQQRTNSPIPFPVSKRVDSSGPSVAIVVPTTPPRYRDGNVDGEVVDHRSPILSPAAKKRLERFDRSVMRIELRSGKGKGKGKEKEQRPEDGAIVGKVKRKREGKKDGEMAVGGGGKQEHGSVRASEEKRSKGKEKEEIKEDKERGASTPKPPETEKRKTAEPLILSVESDSGDERAVRSKGQEHGKGKSKPKFVAKETSRPSYNSDSDSDTKSLTRLKPDERDKEKRQESEALPRRKPATRSRSRLADTEEAEETEDNSSSTRVGTANDNPTDIHICNATSKTVPKTTSKPQSKDDTNAAQAKPRSSTTITTTVRRSANGRSNSFIDDIIPETEESQSQSQEMQVDLQAPKAPHLPVPPATPIRSTLKTRMKPKTPQTGSRPLSRTASMVGALALGLRLSAMDVGVVDENLEDKVDDDVSGDDEAIKKTTNKKANQNGATITKPFGPIPRISPSAFKAHLPPSSLPESIVESTDDSLKRVTEEDDSIEQFESPVKGVGSGLGGERRVGILNAASSQEREKQRVKESASDIWNSDLNRRGQELAEAARKREKERLGADEASSLLTSTLTKSMPRARSAPLGYLATEGMNRLPDLPEDETNPDISMQSLPPDVILPPEDTNSVVQQMEDAYVDLSGGIHEDQITGPVASTSAGASTSAIVTVEGSQSVEVELMADSNNTDMDAETDTGIVEEQLDPIHLRQEEEESTQDLMTELRLYQQQREFGVTETRDDPDDLPPTIQIDSQPIIEATVDDGARKHDADNNDNSGQFVDVIPSITIEKPSRAPSARSYSSVEDGDGLLRQKAESRASRSRSPSVSSQKSKNEEEPDSLAEVPATSSTHRESPQALSQPANFQMENIENSQHLGAAMHLLNAKSEEISKLERQVAAAQQTNEDLLQQLSAIRLHPTESTSDDQSTNKTLEQELAEARAQLALQTASWENERATLVLDIERATRGKASAEQDRDFFREQYAKASGFVSSVRDENAELEKQIKISTDQAQSGVSLIKTTFELRTKSLEEDVRAWRKMAEFLIEKDRRTNDDIRKRAAEEPELRARCDQQEAVLEETSERMEQLEMELAEKQRMYVEAEAAGKRWKEATVSLTLELNEAKTKLERIGKIGISDGDDSAHPDGHEFVYRCQWRPEDSTDACEAVFPHISELQEHLYTGGHLQLD